LFIIKLHAQLVYSFSLSKLTYQNTHDHIVRVHTCNCKCKIGNHLKRHTLVHKGFAATEYNIMCVMEERLGIISTSFASITFASTGTYIKTYQD